METVYWVIVFGAACMIGILVVAVVAWLRHWSIVKKNLWIGALGLAVVVASSLLASSLASRVALVVIPVALGGTGLLVATKIEQAVERANAGGADAPDGQDHSSGQ